MYAHGMRAVGVSLVVALMIVPVGRASAQDHSVEAEQLFRDAKGLMK